MRSLSFPLRCCSVMDNIPSGQQILIFGCKKIPYKDESHSHILYSRTSSFHNIFQWNIPFHEIKNIGIIFCQLEKAIFIDYTTNRWRDCPFHCVIAPLWTIFPVVSSSSPKVQKFPYEGEPHSYSFEYHRIMMFSNIAM